jgi:cytochrome c553
MHRKSSGAKNAATVLAALVLLGLLSIAALGQKNQAPDALAILAKCQQCHGTAVQMSSLSVASRASILQGGNHGPAIVPGNGSESLL